MTGPTELVGTPEPTHRRTEPPRDLRSLARRGALSVIGAGVSALASLALVLVVTRSLNKAEAGAFFSTTSAFTILFTVATLGTTTGLVYFIARSRAGDDTSTVPGHLRAGLLPVAAVSLAAAVALLLAAEPLARLLVGPGQEALAATALRLLAIFVPMAALHQAVSAATQGYHTMAPTVWVDKIGRPVLQLALILAVVLGAATLPGLPAAVLAWSLPYAVALVVTAWWLQRLVRRDRPTQHGVSKTVTRNTREFWTYTGPRGLAVGGQIVLQRLDIVLVAILLGAAPAAVYTAATRFAVLVQLGSQAVALATQSRLGQLAAQNDLASVRVVYRSATAWVIGLTWPLNALSAVYATELLDLFGSGYDQGRWVVVLLAAGMLVATGCGMVSMVLVMLGRTVDNLVNVGVAVAVSVVLDLVLIPHFGLLGAGLAWALAMAVANLLPLAQIHHRFGLHPFDRTTVATGALALACWLVLPLAVSFVTDNAVVTVAALLTAAVAYALGLARLLRPGHTTHIFKGRPQS
ncbi:MAG TPA: lipopolysaccharide biosynthesis protein [Nocardioidaceae bacterium]|nr:lipopolysaccharide biosynthesis protein [Nocardioidaceae bacterium]